MISRLWTSFFVHWHIRVTFAGWEGVVCRILAKRGLEGREHWDPLIRPIVDDLRRLPPEEVDGVVNYVITKILRKYPARYYHYNKAIGVLECIKQEYYRRVVAPCEDKKMQQ